MTQATRVTFRAKALLRHDGKFDPCIEAIVTLDTGSKIVETNIVGHPRLLPHAAEEDARDYLKRRQE